jgi:C-terminal processing protease CtpA/Prc
LHGVHLTPDAEQATYTISTETGVEKKVTLTPVKDNDPIRFISARAKSKSPIPLYLQKIDKNYWYIHLQDQRTMYVQYNLCNDQKGEPSIDAFCRELFKYADAHDFDFFILDLRHNPGGNFKKSAPLVEGIQKRVIINKKGKLFIITSRNTGSAATVTAAQLKVSTEATIVGELSRCNPNFTYNAERFTLPNSKLSVGYTESLHHPFPQLASSLKVDVSSENSFLDVKSGNDRVLEIIWKQNNSKPTQK